MWHTVHTLVLLDILLAVGRTPLIPASFPGKLVTTFGADMTPIKRAAQPREVHHHACALPNMSLCQQPMQHAKTLQSWVAAVRTARSCDASHPLT